MTNLEKMYLEMGKISEVELGTKQMYAKVIVNTLKSIDKRHIDLLHYVISSNSIKGIEKIKDYKSTDIFALKEYLLDLLHCDKVRTISIKEELWLNLSLDELKFVAQAINILKDNEVVAINILRNIRRGLVKYPFDRAYMY